MEVAGRLIGLLFVQTPTLRSWPAHAVLKPCVSLFIRLPFSRPPWPPVLLPKVRNDGKIPRDCLPFGADLSMPLLDIKVTVAAASAASDVFFAVGLMEEGP